MDADRFSVPADVDEVPPVIDAALRVAADDPLLWRVPVAHACSKYDINTDARVWMFVAQCAYESLRFTQLKESLHYSAKRLLEVFPTRFTAEEAPRFAYQDQLIAERVYGGRMGNGPEGSGDGYKYRGRGPIQITGRHTYLSCGNAIGADLIEGPELLELPMHAALSAAWFWFAHGCNALADANDFEAVTKAIVGGMTGYDDRVAWLDKLRAVT